MRFSAISLVSLTLPALLLSISVDALPPSNIVKLHARDAVSDWDLSKTPYLGKGPVSTRAPCPMLNTLANHGVLPFSGLDITRDILKSALTRIGVAPDLIAVLIDSAFKGVGRQGKAGEVIDLAGLQQHNKLEHDASLSRQDFDVTGDDATLNITLFRQLELFLKKEGNQQYLDPHSVGDARKLRLLQATRDNPKVDFSSERAVAAHSESAVLLDGIGRNGRVSREFLESFFLHERFPASWKPLSPPYTLAQLRNRVSEASLFLNQSTVTLEWEKKPLPQVSQ